MELIKKTTILFPPALHEHLVRIAAQRGVSLGELVRSACETQYGRVSSHDRLKAVERLRALSLPVASPSRMKRESVVGARDLLPGDLGAATARRARTRKSR